MIKKGYLKPEISIDLMQERLKVELGTYSLIYNEECQQIDEILNLF